MSRPGSHLIELAPPCLPGVDAVAMVSDRSFPRHAHDQFGIGVMQSGGHVSWSGCGRVEAGPGDVIAVSPEEMHDGAPVDGTRAWAMLFLDPSAIAKLVGEEAGCRELGFAVRRSPEVARAVTGAFSAIRSGCAAAAEERLTDLFGDLLTLEPLAADRAPSLATRRVRDRIRDRPEAPPSLDEVAELMDMSRTGALRRYRREVGATPHEDAMQVRLRLARRALADGMGPAAIAADLGFADQSHLTRAFGRQFGLSPGRFRTSRGNIVQDGDGMAEA